MFGIPIGSLAQVGTFLTVLVGVGGLFLKFRGQTLDASLNQVKQYEVTCQRLRSDVTVAIERIAKCERDCARDKQELMNELHGQRRQHMQEQISLISAIMQSVDNPQLKGLLNTLESVQIAISRNVLHSQFGTVIPKEDEKPDGS